LLRSLRLTIALSCLALVCAAGCQSAPAPAMRLGTNVWPGYEPLFLARSLGHLPKDEIKLVEYHSTSEVIRSFKNGTLEAAALTLDELILLQQAGFDAVAFLVCDVSHGADAIVARAPLAAMSDLAGRRIGVEGAALGSFVFSRALEIAGLEATPPVAVEVDVSRHETAWDAGEVDAVVTFEPMLSRLVKRGGTVVFTSRDMPGEIVDVLVVSRAYAEAHPERIMAIEKGWFGALDMIDRTPTKAMELMAPRQGLTAEQLRAGFDGLRLPDSVENAAYLRGEAPWLVEISRRLGKSMGTELSPALASSLILPRGDAGDR